MIRPEEMAIIVVGDADEIRPQLETLGLSITELDEEGQPVAGQDVESALE